MCHSGTAIQSRMVISPVSCGSVQYNTSIDSVRDCRWESQSANGDGERLKFECQSRAKKLNDLPLQHLVVQLLHPGYTA